MCKGIPERRAISAEEVAKHTDEDDMWVSCHGLVLQLNKKFIEEHPGGAEVLTDLAGKDITEAFEDIGHSRRAREWADKYIIGYLEGEPEEAKTKMMPGAHEAVMHIHRGGGGWSMLTVIGAVAVGAAAVALTLIRAKRR